jgi:hypothetical protein
MASYAQFPTVIVCELIQQHEIAKAANTCGVFVNCIATLAGLYTRKKQHKQEHNVDAKLDGLH